MNKNAPWTYKEWDKALALRCLLGSPYASIARKLRRSRKSVERIFTKFTRMKKLASPREQTEEQREDRWKWQLQGELISHRQRPSQK